MRILRTPETAFAGIADFGYAPNYVSLASGVRMHYIDEGEGPVVLLMHGEPTWSYLYRNVIPILVDAGFRVIAPDLVGFGRSDKPADIDDYTYANHVGWVGEWLDEVGLSDITIFVQDWGGLIGLRLVAADPDRFIAVIAANTGLPTGDQVMPEAFAEWREFSRSVASFDAGSVVTNGTVRELSDEAVAAYRAPFPDDSFLAGARIFPALVPASPDDPEAESQRAAWARLTTFGDPFVTAFSDSDPITAGGERPFHKLVAGCNGMPHRTIEGAGHFLQEDQPEAVAMAIIDTFALTN